MYPSMQWQKQQVEAYCRRYELTNVEYQFPPHESRKRTLFRHLIFYDKKKVIFAFIPKVSQPSNNCECVLQGFWQDLNWGVTANCASFTSSEVLHWIIIHFLVLRCKLCQQGVPCILSAEFSIYMPEFPGISFWTLCLQITIVPGLLEHMVLTFCWQYLYKKHVPFWYGPEELLKVA